MKLATPTQMKKLDELAMDVYKIPDILLMENAALCIVAKAMEMLADAMPESKTVIIAGKGNNGGDAFAVARHLIQSGYPVIVVSLVQRSMVKGEADTYLQILENIGATILFVTDEAEMPRVEESLKEAHLIIDGIFGTGFYGNVTGLFKSVIRLINESSAKVLSIDIPSGVNGENGQVGGIAVKADETVTFSLLKPGLAQYPGAELAGKVTVADIGIPTGATRQLRLDGQLSAGSELCKYFPQRFVEGHKTTFGKILIITGSKGMTGAGTLAAKAAFKTGSGMVYLAVPKSLLPIYSITVPEAITIPLDDEDGLITDSSLNMLLEKSESMDSIVIGPGLTTKRQVAAWVKEFICKCKRPMVIDADALNIMAETVAEEKVVVDEAIVKKTNTAKEIMTKEVIMQETIMQKVKIVEKTSIAEETKMSGKTNIAGETNIVEEINILGKASSAKKANIFEIRQAPIVVTPHPGEFARLTGLTADEIRANRIKLAVEYSHKWGVTVVLKGAGTVIANPDGKYYINPTGNPVLATAGSGDVLAGIIGSFIGQGVKPLRASTLGVYVHGMCGDILDSRSNIQAGYTASEICAEIPLAMGKLISESGCCLGYKAKQSMGGD